MEKFLTYLALAIVSVVVWFLVRRAVVKRKLTCPVKQKAVEVEFLRDGFHGEGAAKDVVSCSAFEDPKKLDCKKECLTESK